jgi:hypothetical protein
VALLLLFFYGLVRASAWWVLGREYREAVKQRDEWKTLALRGSEGLLGLTEVAKKSTDSQQSSLDALQQAIEVVDAIRRAEEK